ncbi:MAG: acyltransferase family protein, partial [Spirochaetaceae bacterium]|nr:acyltransferase family protein [Spirochaetaceae bacterium]
MRKHWLDNIRWATVVLVVFYHVVWEYNAEGILGGLGKITSLETQWIDLLMYIVYPWFMPLLFIVSGISAKLYLEQHTDREFFKSRTTKLLVPSTIGVLVFGFVQGYLSMAIGGAFDSMAEVPPFVLYLIMCASGIGVLWYIQLLWVFS